MIQVYQHRWTPSFKVILKDNKTILGSGHNNNINFYPINQRRKWVSVQGVEIYKLIGTYKSFNEYVAENFAELV